LLQAELSKQDLGDSIQRLADSGAFACASSMRKSRGRTGVARLGGAFSGQTCICYGVTDERPMSECRVLMFLSASLRTTAYEIMLEQNRRPLHMSAAHFLEEKIRRLSTTTMNENSLYESYMLEDEDEEGPRKDDRSAARSSAAATPADEDPDDKQSTPDSNEAAKDDERSVKKERKKSSRRSGSIFIRPGRKASRRVAPTSAKQAHAQRLKTIIGGEGFAQRDQASIAVSEFINKQLQSTKRRSSTNAADRAASAALTADLADLSASVVVNYTGFERLGVLRIQYPQIADQYRGAGNTQNTVFYLTEAAAACLALFDHHGAITHLREVNKIFRALKKNQNPFEGRVANLDDWKPEPYDEGQMESLVGQTLFGMEKPKKATPHFHRALKLFGCEQVSSSLRMRFRTTMELRKHNATSEPATELEARLLSSQAHCLFYIFEDCVARNDLAGARYAAVQQFVKTERANDLLGQIEAATCLLKLAHLTNDVAGVREHENKAKIKCIVAMQNVRNDQVIRLTQMYWTAFEIHCARSPLTEAVESGMAASRMVTAMRGGGVIQVNMLASLVNALIYADRVRDAVDVLDIIHVDTGRAESRCWYFLGCMQMVLTLGVRVALVEDCVAYSEEVLAQRMFVKRPQLLFCLACSLCLYYKRIRAEDRFEEWRKIAAQNEPTRYDSFILALAFVDLLECKLLLLSRLIGEMRRATAIRQSAIKESITSVNEMDKRYLERVISRDISFAQRMTRHLLALEPRMLVLQAYYAAIRDKMNSAYALLQRAVQRADELANSAHARWTKHNIEVWFKESVTARGGDDEEDTVPTLSGTSSGQYAGGPKSTIQGRRSTLSQRHFSTVSPQAGPAAARVESADDNKHRRSAALAVWMQERGLNQRRASISGEEASDLRDQWLKSANSTFPFWYIVNHVRNQTRMLLTFALPLPHWFAARMF